MILMEVHNLSEPDLRVILQCNNILVRIPFGSLLAIRSGAFLGVRQVEKKNILENERRTKIYQEYRKIPA